MATSKNGHTVGLLILAVAMLATRLHHFEYLPDASWAIFFLSGFHLFGARAAALLMVEAVVIDYVATVHLGVSSYCLSIAYPFVVPAYATLWLGGRWAARHRSDELPHRVGWLVVCLLVSVAVCFLLTNGSFYWLSGRAASPTVAGWAVGFQRWYPYFLAVPCIYVAMAVVAQWLGTRLRISTRDASTHTPRQG
jgi:hypothetical protein